MRKSWLYISLLLSLHTYSQDSTAPGKPDSLSYRNKARKWMVGVGTAAVYGTSFIYLNEAWYKGYPRSAFHAFNDAGEWMQMDKIGHAWSAYTTGRVTYELWRWAGVDQKNALLLGPGTSLLYMLSIEYLDGRSAEWGWSWADVAADFAGAFLFAGQELGWQQQKIQLKFSSHKKKL